MSLSSIDSDVVDLVSRHIDKLEQQSQTNANTHNTTNTEKPLKEQQEREVQQQYQALVSQLETVSSPSDRESFLSRHLVVTLRVHTLLKHELDEWKQRFDRQKKQRETLEKLDKELQQRNKALTDQLHRSAADHAELRSRFEASLSSIQQQLDAHSTEREKHLLSSEQMKEHMNKLLAYDKAREEQHNNIIKAKEMETQLLNAQIQQLQQQHTQLTLSHSLSVARESELSKQLTDYSDKFNTMNTLIQQSNSMFDSMKGELTKCHKQMSEMEKRHEKDQQQLIATTKQLLTVTEERQAEAQELARVKRQKETLAALCNKLEQDRKKAITNNTTKATDTQIQQSIEEAATTPAQASAIKLTPSSVSTTIDADAQTSTNKQTGHEEQQER